jgi:hypothetical protein
LIRAFDLICFDLIDLIDLTDLTDLTDLAERFACCVDVTFVESEWDAVLPAGTNGVLICGRGDAVGWSAPPCLVGWRGFGFLQNCEEL